MSSIKDIVLLVYIKDDVVARTRSILRAFSFNCYDSSLLEGLTGNERIQAAR